MDWDENFNPLDRSGLFRPARQLDKPKYGPVRSDSLTRFKKNKIK